MKILMPHHLYLKLLAFRFVVVTKVSVVSFHWNFAHQLLNRHRLEIGDSATSTFVLAAVKAWFVITTNVFKYKAVGHLVELERLRIITHQFAVCNVFKTHLKPLKLTQV